jgi:hypothetical protein
MQLHLELHTPDHRQLQTGLISFQNRASSTRSRGFVRPPSRSGSGRGLSFISSTFYYVIFPRDIFRLDGTSPGNVAAPLRQGGSYGTHPKVVQVRACNQTPQKRGVKWRDEEPSNSSYLAGRNNSWSSGVGSGRQPIGHARGETPTEI